MENYICVTCGVQYGQTDGPPAVCIICADERQYIGWSGQRWATLSELRDGGKYRNEVRELEPDLLGIGIEPSIGIGQRALLVRTSSGNILWDCLAYLDDETVARVSDLGGIDAIAFSHPHFYGSMVDWSRAFDGARLLVPEADREWAVRDDPAIEYWSGTLELAPGVTLAQTGGHFEGSALIHWAAGADGRGALLVGDTLQVAQDRRWVSIMRSYPNYIPMNGPEVRSVVESFDSYEYDRVYGGWWGRNIESGAKEAVRRSADRYVERISD